MNEALRNSSIILLTITVLLLIVLRECKDKVCPPQGAVLVSQSYLDSLVAEARKPAQVVIKDSVRHKDTIIYIDRPVPLPMLDSSHQLRVYRDSIITDSLRLWDEIHVNGTLEKHLTWYKPVIFERIETITKPYPVPVNIPTEIDRREVYLSALFGGNSKGVVFGGSLDYTYKDRTFGLQYQKLAEQDYLILRAGFSLFKR